MKTECAKAKGRNRSGIIKILHFLSKGKIWKNAALLIVGTILLGVYPSMAQEISHGEAWKAQWISTEKCQSATNTWLAYRKTIELQTVPRKAIAKIAADSKYWLWVNGQMIVFEGGLKRGPNPLDTYYDEIDLAPFLKNGKNTIALLLWYFGKDGFSHKSSGRAGMIFDCQSEDFELLSDNTWKCSVLKSYQTAGLPSPNFRLPESSILYDARFDIGTWQQENYDDSKMSKATVLGKAGDYPWNGLHLRPVPLFKYTDLNDYVREPQIIPGENNDTVICQLPYNAQVTPYLHIEAPKGEKITICTDNYLYYTGGTDNIRAEYITKKGVQEYESLGWMNGHKVYYIIPRNVKVIDLKYRESGYNADFAGHFNCSDPFFNKLWEKSRRTLYLTMRDTYMDCPDRERAQWTGDAVNESGEAFYALSVSAQALAKKWLHELIQWQKSDGSLFAPVPAGNWSSELPSQSLASIGYYGLWTYYQYSGDKQTIADLYDGAKRYLNLWEPDGHGTMKLREGGWSWGDWGEDCDLLLVCNLWYYLAIKGMHLMAAELGKRDDVVRLSQVMSNFKASFNQQFWTGTAYRDPKYQGKNDDRTQALAVVSGIADENKYPALLKVFLKEEHASPYMEKYVFEAMMQMGYEREAMERNKKRFEKMVNNDYFSTVFEGWGFGDESYGFGTVNHAWSGGSLTVLSQYACGIAPVEPGFSKFQVMPQPGLLSSASATMESVRGIIRSSWKKYGRTFELQVSVPSGTTSVIGIPSGKVTRITMNHQLIWKKGHYLDKKIMPEAAPLIGRICIEVPEGEWRLVAQ